MKSFEEKIAHIQKIKMSGSEKETVRAHLLQYMEQSPRGGASVPVHSPYMHRVFGMPLMRGLVLGALVLVVSGGGLVFASESALPGDALYKMKIHVTENIRGVLAVNTEAKARWQADRVDTRLNEMAELKTEGRLENGPLVEAQVAFTENTEALSKSLTKLTLEGKQAVRTSIINTLRLSFDKVENAQVSAKGTNIRVKVEVTPNTPAAARMMKVDTDTGLLLATIQKQKEKILASETEIDSEETVATADSENDNPSSVGINTASIVQNNYGILEGKVSIGPICPVAQVGNPCLPTKETFTSREIVIFTQNTHTEVVRTHLKEDGSYVIQLPTGSYTVEIAANGIDSSKELPKTVTISSGTKVKLDFSIDTGIRTPLSSTNISL